MESRLSGISGIILAGGRSSRYGRNKALVEINGIRVIERVIRVMEPLFERLIIITNTPQDYAYLKLPMVEDLIKGLGPLGGIFTGLQTMSDEAGFFVACDMPFLSGDLVRHMVDVMEDFDVVVPKVDWKVEPLHAIYTKRCIPAIKELIDNKDYQIIKCFQSVRIRYLSKEEIYGLDPELRSFFNINRPEELLKATRSKNEKT
ncbi:MAG: molybdenum cofactor guanylyltransferase [Desulfobacteraceae bacterium]|jgi:molybdopterin-guanine dinucleotide biosynthesis protein A